MSDMWLWVMAPGYLDLPERSTYQGLGVPRLDPSPCLRRDMSSHVFFLPARLRTPTAGRDVQTRAPVDWAAQLVFKSQDLETIGIQLKVVLNVALREMAAGWMPSDAQMNPDTLRSKFNRQAASPLHLFNVLHWFTPRTSGFRSSDRCHLRCHLGLQVLRLTALRLGGPRMRGWSLDSCNSR